MNELKNRGIGDILIAVVDGLKGFPEAINAVFPLNRDLDLYRASLSPPPPKKKFIYRKLVVPALKAIYDPQERRSWPEGLGGVRDKLLQVEKISDHRPELAAQLASATCREVATERLQFPLKPCGMLSSARRKCAIKCSLLPAPQQGCA